MQLSSSCLDEVSAHRAAAGPFSSAMHKTLTSHDERTVRLDGLGAAHEQLRADGAGVVRLHRQDASRIAQVGFALNEGCGAVVGRHADILEEESAVQEDQVALRQSTAVFS